jgi:hypothetical protein
VGLPLFCRLENEVIVRAKMEEKFNEKERARRNREIKRRDMWSIKNGKLAVRKFI